jgi:polyphenol oxidase
MSKGILFADNISALPNVRHAFFTRAWDNFGLFTPGTDRIEVASQKRVAKYFDVPYEHYLCCRQIHSPNVVTIGNMWPCWDKAPEADAMVTNKAGIALGILTADCVPVLLAASNISVIGAAHAGWRGALGNVLERTVEAMEKLGAQRKDIQAALGPCIGQESYEVSPEFPSPFLKESSGNERFFKPSIKKGHYQFDLQGYVIEKLHISGVTSVCPPPADTCADPGRFYSHRYSTLRGEKRKGTLVSAIVIRA